MQGHRPWPELFNLMYFHDKSVQLCYRARRNFVLWTRTPWDETQSELWAVWVCSLQFSHPINTTLKPWGSSHFFTDVVCTSSARGKDRALFCHFSFVIETENSPSRRAFTKALVFYHVSKGHGVPKNWDSRDAAKAIDFFFASSPHRNDTPRANSLPKSGSWQYRHPRSLLLTSFPPHMTLDCWILKAAPGWFICLRKIKP